MIEKILMVCIVLSFLVIIIIVILSIKFKCVRENLFDKLAKAVELLLIGSIGIVIAYAQYKTYLNNMQPYFQIKAYYNDKLSEIQNGDIIIDVYNIDGKADNVEVDMVSALYIEKYRDKDNIKVFKLNDYYSYRVISGNDVNKICSFMCPESNLQLKKLYDEYIDTANVNIENYVKISYYDMNKNHHEEYYRINWLKTEHYINKDEGRKKFKSIETLNDEISMSNLSKSYIENISR
jgi:hypothetical protein